MKSISGTTAAIGAWLFALSSTEPPIVTEYPAGSPFANSVHLRRELIHDGLRLHGVEDACLERYRGNPRSPPDCRLLDFVAQRGHGSERDRLAAQADQLQVPQRIDRCALRRGRAAHHIHQVNAVAHLRDRGAGKHAVQRRRDVLRAHAKLARLVLQHIDLDDARRLHPVEHDMIEVRIGAHDAGEVLGKFPHLGDIGSAQPILHGTPDRRSDLEQFDEGIRARKGLLQIGFELRLERDHARQCRPW